MSSSFKRILLMVVACAACMLPVSSLAAGDLTNQAPIEITVQLGNEKNALAFFPETITMETGKLYKLVLTNPSPQKHYFSSEGMAQGVFTRKVQVNGPDGKAIAEIKGQIREIEVYPGGKTEWWMVPVKTGNFSDLKCTIPGHTQGGMTGKIIIK
ncbi:MAG: hypothetical protein H6Q57_1764 [Geobacteraceae bacterium]|nr:hypothetical protein [Geobacteraceae bacterium]